MKASVDIDFEFKNIKLSLKQQELYNQIIVDCIAPYWYIVVKESKYCNDLEKLSDKYRVSIERQSLAYNLDDYNSSKAIEIIVKNFSSMDLIYKWLRYYIRKNFKLVYDDNEI